VRKSSSRTKPGGQRQTNRNGKRGEERLEEDIIGVKNSTISRKEKQPWGLRGKKAGITD